MDGNGILLIVSFVLFIVVVVAIIVGKKVKKEKKWKRDREEKYKREAEEKQKINNLKNKIANNKVTQEWITKIVSHCKNIIKEKANYDLSWEIVTEKQDFYFGHNLQRMHYKHINTTEYINTPIRLLVFHFSEVGLPEFANDTDASKFSKAMAEIVKEQLKSDSIDVEIKEYDRTIVHHSDDRYYFDSCKLYSIKYTRKKVSGDW